MLIHRNAAPLANQECSEQLIRCSLRLFGLNRHIVIFHSGIHYVKLLLDGKGCRDAGLVPPRAQYGNLTILYHPDN